MNTIFRTVASSAAVLALSGAALLGSASALGQVLLLDIPALNVPLAAVLDNPCTAATEAIAFQGSAQLSQRVWQLVDGSLRVQITESTTLAGEDTAVLLAPRPQYSAAGYSESDLELLPASFTVLSYKKVMRPAGMVDDNFHSLLVLEFDPSTLKLSVKLAGICETGAP
jgi:hypothetical protein